MTTFGQIPRGPPSDRGQNFFHFPRFQANEHLQYRHHFGGQHHHRFHHNHHRKPFIFHNRNHEPMDRERVLRQSFRDNFRDLATGGGRYHHRPNKTEGAHAEANVVELSDGINAKQMKKPTQRKTVDYNSSVVNYLENRVWQRDGRDRRAFNPDKLHHLGLIPPQAMMDNPMNAVASRHIRTSVNKNKCPIFCVAWTPEGRRLVTGAHSGEFVLWNGLTFNFETILQAHDISVRAMRWSHNDLWMITADNNGFIKYWQSNMNNVKMYQAHKETIRALSFCPSDSKFASCSDDGTVRIWDFARCTEERILRGHGADVKCVDWHPQKSIVISGSKDAQQPIKIWDPRTGVALTTLHAHKNTCMDVKWGMNGHLFLTASRDHLIKLFDVRNMKEDVLTYKGHKKEVTNVAWNPIHESLFASAGSDGSIMFWTTSGEKEVGCMHQAHDGLIWSLSWHPVGHILASGSNDHCVKFWGRNRLGDTMRDRYNLNLNPTGLGDDEYYDETAAEGVSLIPGMGIEQPAQQEEAIGMMREDTIPGFEWTDEDKKVMAMERRRDSTIYYKSKPLKHAIKRVPESFERAWESGEQTVVTPKEATNIGPDAENMKLEDLMGAPIMTSNQTLNHSSPMLKLSSLNLESEFAQIAKLQAESDQNDETVTSSTVTSSSAMPNVSVASSLLGNMNMASMSNLGPLANLNLAALGNGVGSIASMAGLTGLANLANPMGAANLGNLGGLNPLGNPMANPMMNQMMMNTSKPMDLNSMNAPMDTQNMGDVMSRGAPMNQGDDNLGHGGPPNNRGDLMNIDMNRNDDPRNRYNQPMDTRGPPEPPRGQMHQADDRRGPPGPPPPPAFDPPPQHPGGGPMSDGHGGYMSLRSHGGTGNRFDAVIEQSRMNVGNSPVEHMDYQNEDYDGNRRDPRFRASTRDERPRGRGRGSRGRRGGRNR